MRSFIRLRARIAIVAITLFAGCLLSACVTVEDAETSEPQASELLTTPTVAVSETITPSQGQRDRETVIVKLEKGDYEQVAPLEAVDVIAYRSFVWLELTEEGFNELAASGVDFARPPAPTTLEFEGYRFDTRSEEPTVPAEQRAQFTPGVPSFHVVQLKGPVKGEWLDQLQERSVEFVQPHPPYGYIVSMVPEQAAAVEAFDFVRWVGPYHPAFKIGSSLKEVMEHPFPTWVHIDDGKIENVDIKIYKGDEVGESLADTVKAIEALGGELIYVSKGGAMAFAYATFRLPVAAIVSTAQLNNVLLLDYGSPEIIPEESVPIDSGVGAYFNNLIANQCDGQRRHLFRAHQAHDVVVVHKLLRIAGHLVPFDAQALFLERRNHLIHVQQRLV